MNLKKLVKFYLLDFSKESIIMKKRIYIVLLLGSIVVNASYAQKGKIDNAIKQYNTLSYVKSSAMLLSLVKDGNRSPEVLQNLANAFYLNGNMKEASQWYGELMALKLEIDPEVYFRYAQSLKSMENYLESDKIMHEFSILSPEDSRVKAFLLSPNYLKGIADLSVDFQLENLNINTEYSDFGTAVYNSIIYFASSRGDGRNYNWNAQPYLDIYSSSDTSNDKVQGVLGDVNTKYHESSAVFTKDGATMYFTRNNYYNGKFKKNSKNRHSLKIYKASLVNGKWTNIESLPFNNDEYSTSHPALSSDESKLYFASDMPGTLGNSDIFFVAVNEDGTYGIPKNLGKTINTEGRENFPFISKNGTLYFSSEGHLGLGGLDVFKFENIDDISSSTDVVFNIGKPINSPKDDFGYVINSSTLKGYVSSNRPGGKGDDDIYSFTLPIPIQALTGIVLDKQTGEPLANATISIYDEQKNVVSRLTSNAIGKFNTTLNNKKQSYTVLATLETYSKDEQSFEVLSTNSNGEFSLKMTLEPLSKIVEVGTDLFEHLNLAPINFDFDKSNIRPDAEIELAKVIDYMKKYPTLKIDVRSHTDSRGNDNYNLALSERRNKSTINYIINNGGVSSERLTGKGYGESATVNKCSNGVKCTKEEHEANRRSEFIVVAN